MKRKKRTSVILVGVAVGVASVLVLGVFTLDTSRGDNVVHAIKATESLSQESREEVQVPLMTIKIPSGYPYPSSWRLERIAEEMSMNPKELAELNGLALTDFIDAGEIITVKPYTATNIVLVSWYGPGFHGKTMANGEVFNMYDATICAHKFLPFGTRIRLTRDSGKSVEVIVKDRGPFIPGRHFDLSYQAAKELGMIKEGVIQCQVEILDWPH